MKGGGSRAIRLGTAGAPALILAGAALATTWPLLNGRIVGGIDARWYAYMLKDFIGQERAGHFPVFLGQGDYAWNGGIHPFRTAPVFLWLGGVWDFLTGRALEATWLQHLAAVTSALAGVLGFYAAGITLAPRRRAEVALLSLLYLWGGGWPSALYWGDAYMTYMAFGALPLVAYGNARSWLTMAGAMDFSRPGWP